MTTRYHSQYWANALTLQQPGGSIDGISRAIANARVDLNPHQVEAALFAVRSPLTRGVILADEVGLGKTIEAGLVISQRWAERRKRILVVVPASLRKQWQQELEDKFHLPSIVLEARSWKRMQAEGRANPFEVADHLVICSYQFAARHYEEVASVAWDLVVVDEAHRLRNVYRPGARTARALVAGIGNAPKVLLTATPLQNSLMELYGLVSVADPHIFGDPASFREQFVRLGDDGARDRLLRLRLAEVCHRTLRRQVLEYVRFTQRIPLTQEFFPSDEEHELYEKVSDYLRRDVLFSLPSGQRTLMQLVLRKLLASSSFAIADTLATLVDRLRGLKSEAELAERLREEVDTFDDTADELEEESSEGELVDAGALTEELKLLEELLGLARRIASNSKADALVRALAIAFEQMASAGAARKAVVFTESRRTQEYLARVLDAAGYRKVVLLNGSNTDEGSTRILEAWRDRHADDDLATGSRAVDVKAAIVESFRDEAEILLATEAAAEGVNLQFCSLVVNYDLPWNPQRVEQRIGRCHRYGQKHDVVVVNFLNQRNAADVRVYELLAEKFRLFEGVFGASDEILGTLESGVDIERRIADVYRTCRGADEIEAAFDSLRAELDEQIRAEMDRTRLSILENFDEDVQARLRVHRDQAAGALNERERHLLQLARFELASEAEFEAEEPRFLYTGRDARHGWYNLDWRGAEARGETFFRLDHPLAARIAERARQRSLCEAALQFDYSGQGVNIAALTPLVSNSGWLSLGLLRVDSLETEEFLVWAGQADDGLRLDAEQCEKLFGLPARETGPAPSAGPGLEAEIEAGILACMSQVENRNALHFDAEVAKLDRWSDDLKVGLERELKELDGSIREARKVAAVATALADKLAAQREIKTLEQKRNRKRRDLFEEQDRIDGERATLIEGIERQLASTQNFHPLFRVRWSLI